jgi:phenylalanyl-tRNA synthetase alpha chain
MLKDDLIELREKAIEEIEGISTEKELDEVRIRYLGRKRGLSKILRRIGELPLEERPIIGQMANRIKEEIEERLAEKRREILSRVTYSPIDITMPPPNFPIGKLHPITKILDEIIEIFSRMGFEVVEGPEVEYSVYNFDALNILEDHPARDMHDTFYIEGEDLLLRTHTSPVQIRVMKERMPPLRIIVPGKVYRRDADISHSPMFHQVEGFLVDEETSFSDLKGVLDGFLKELFGKIGVRFRPSFFPFTEPSAEVDIACMICKGRGCRVCKGTGWLEVMGAGMVDPEVFKNVGYDPERYLGFAFGMGVERIAMLRYGIDDIRLFFENEIRFLDQF